MSTLNLKDLVAAMEGISPKRDGNAMVIDVDCPCMVGSPFQKDPDLILKLKRIFDVDVIRFNLPYEKEVVSFGDLDLHQRIELWCKQAPEISGVEWVCIPKETE